MSATAIAQRPQPSTPPAGTVASRPATPAAPSTRSTTTPRLASNTTFSRAYGAGMTAYNLSQLPGHARAAYNDIRAAIRNPSRENVSQAVVSGARAGKTGLSAARDGLTLAGNVQNYRMARSAAANALRAASPGVSEATVRAASSAAARSAVGGASRQVARAAVRQAAGRGAQVAATAARAAIRGGGGALARAAGRFAPGANVAIAALDTASAVATLRDPRASTGRRICSVITAAGSIAAATNIPVVSQVGAVVSGVSSFIGGFFR